MIGERPRRRRRSLAAGALSAGALSAAFLLSTGLSGCGMSPDAVHERATVVDLHMDTLGPVMTGRDFSIDNPVGHVDLPKLHRGGYDLMFWSIWVPPVAPGREPHYNADANKMIDALDALIAKYPDDLALVRNASETYAANRAGKIGCAIGVEGGHMLDDRPSNLQAFYDRGVRYITLTWNNSNAFATSATDESSEAGVKDPGLTEQGRTLVREMNRLGIVVDVSHVGEKTFWDVLEVSEDPVVATHSGAKALCDVYRNLTDEQIQAVASKGGVIGLTYVASFVDPDYSARRSEALARVGEGAELLTDELFDWDRDRYYTIQDSLLGSSLDAVRPSLDAFLDHVDHVANIAGVDAIALGSDFDGTSLTPRGLEDAGQLKNLTRALLARGYTPEDVQKMLGGNFMRVLETVTGK